MIECDKHCLRQINRKNAFYDSPSMYRNPPWYYYERLYRGMMHIHFIYSEQRLPLFIRSAMFNDLLTCMYMRTACWPIDTNEKYFDPDDTTWYTTDGVTLILSI